jgi:hypothetical protein
MLKGQYLEIFEPSVFSLKGTPVCPDSWATKVLNTGSDSRRNLIRFDYENRLRAMPHSAEFRLCAMPHSTGSDSALCGKARSFKKVFICDSALCDLVWNSSQQFSCRLRAMGHSAGSTYIREFHCEFATIRKNILTRWSVTQVRFIHEKNRGSKISWNCPFKWYAFFCLVMCGRQEAVILSAPKKTPTHAQTTFHYHCNVVNSTLYDFFLEGGGGGGGAELKKIETGS